MAAHYTLPRRCKKKSAPTRWGGALLTMIWVSRPFSARRCDAKNGGGKRSERVEKQMRWRQAAATIALISAIGLAVGAGAEPLSIRIGWVVTPGHMAPLVEALGKRDPTVFKHLGQSFILQPIRFNGTSPQIQAHAIGDLEIASYSTSALALAITNAHLDERVVADVIADGHPGYFTENFVVLKDGPIHTVEDVRGRRVAT